MSIQDYILAAKPLVPLTITGQSDWDSAPEIGVIGGGKLGPKILTDREILSASGWTFNPSYMARDTGTASTSAGMSPADYPFWAGSSYANRATAPVRITPAGSMFLGDPASTYLILNGSNVDIGTSDYVSGVTGWRIHPLYAEFANAFIRGELHSTIFVKDLIDARAGTLIVAKSAGKLSANTTIPAAGTWTITIDDAPGGGFLFANSDICRMQAETASGVASTWFTVSGRVDNGNGTQTYTCTYASGTLSVIYTIGSPVIDYGVSGDGFLLMTADLASPPYYDVLTHAGAPWTTTTIKARLGNLAGVTDATLNPTGYGLYTTNGYFSGTVVSTTGTIGGWSIGASAITDTAGVVGMSSAVTAGDDIRFWAGDATPASAEFRVTEAGALTATSATITGAITATSGTIGSFTIGTYLYTGTKTAWNDVNAGVHLGSDGIGIGNNVFTVSSAGALVATSATIAGAITATSGAIGGWTITGDDLTCGTIVLHPSAGTAYIALNASDRTTGNGAWFAALNTTAEFRVGSVAAGVLTNGIMFDQTNLSFVGVNTSLTAAGVFTASNAAITGAITATSGTIGGWTIGAGSLSNAHVTFNAATQNWDVSSQIRFHNAANDVEVAVWSERVNGGAAFVLINDARTWQIGVLGSASDAFIIRDSNAGSDRVTIDTSGNVTLVGNLSMASLATVDGVDISVHTHNGAGQGGTVPMSAVSGTVSTTQHGSLGTITNAHAVADITGAAPTASPTFTGTVTVPTPFTIGAVSMTATGTELNYVVGVTSAIQTQLGTKAPLASPTFTGTVIFPDSGRITSTGFYPGNQTSHYITGGASGIGIDRAPSYALDVGVSAAAETIAVRLINANAGGYAVDLDFATGANSNRSIVRLVAPVTGSGGYLDIQTANSGTGTMATGIRILDTNVTVYGTLTVNGNQAGATDHVFDAYDDIALLQDWRAGKALPFATGDLLNRDRLLRDSIVGLHARIARLEAQVGTQD